MLHTMQEKEIKSTQIEKGGIKWSLFSDNLTVHRGNKKIPTKKSFQNQYMNLARFQDIGAKYQMYFYVLTMIFKINFK